MTSPNESQRRLIERTDGLYLVDAGADAVTVQTIHSVKGLEHPIVILGNMNSGAFPPAGGSGGSITYSETAGLRQKKCYAEVHGDPYVYDNWRADVLRKCQPTEYDEERRLLYVAMTRAKDHLLFGAGNEPNSFLEGVPVEIESLEPAVSTVDVAETAHTQFSVEIPESTGPVGYSPHSLMDDSVYEDVSDGRGMEFGSRVHEFAEDYVLGTEVTSDSDDEKHVKAFLDGLSGELTVEERAYLPLEADGEQVTLSGIIDLVHLTADTVEIIDFKTDLSRHAESEYRIQLSVYYHILEEWFGDRAVTASIFYTAEGARVEIDPLSKSELSERLA